jgi:hypothetical protein
MRLREAVLVTESEVSTDDGGRRDGGLARLLRACPWINNYFLIGSL